MIIFSDIDGTLYPHTNNKDVETLSRNIESVQRWRKKGNIFVLATGRGIKSVARLLPDYNRQFDYVITDNGGYVFANSKAPIISNTINSKRLDLILGCIESTLPYDSFGVSYYTHDNELKDIPSAAGKMRVWFYNEDIMDIAITALENSFDDIIIHSERHRVRPSLPWLSTDFSCFINISDVNSGKNMAIAQLLEMLKISSDDVASIGDDENDRSMLEQYNGYIMRDSNPKLLRSFSDDRKVDSVSDLLDNKLKFYPFGF